MKKTILTAIITMVVIVANAQSKFEKVYGGTGNEYGYSVLETNTNGYIVTGYTTSFGAGGRDIWLIKTDANGDTLWTRTYGGTESDEGRSIQQTNENGYIIAGGTESFGAGGWDAYLIKTDANGDTLWTKTYGGSSDDEAYAVEQTYDSGYVITGYTRSFGIGGWEDIWLIRTDINGDTLWTKTFGGPVPSDYGYSVKQTSDSGYIVTGQAMSFFPGTICLIRTDKNGSELWTKTYGGINYDEGRSVLQTSDGGYAVAGLTNIAGASDVILIKTNAVGDTLWTRTYGGLEIDVGLSLQQTNDNGYIIAGATGSFGAGHYDYYLIKTNANGDTLWTRTFGKTSLDYAYSVRPTNDDGYVIVGRKLVWLVGTSDIYMVKTDSLGNSIPLGGRYHFKEEQITNRVFPNPFTESTVFEIKGMELPGTFIMYDVFGREVKRLQISSSGFRVERDGLSDGVYFYYISNSTGHLLTGKLVVH